MYIDIFLLFLTTTYEFIGISITFQLKIIYRWAPYNTAVRFLKKMSCYANPCYMKQRIVQERGLGSKNEEKYYYICVIKRNIFIKAIVTKSITY